MKKYFLLLAVFLLPLFSTYAETTLSLTRSLTLGTKGVDVSALQTFLKQTGDFTYPEITGYYGQLTADAVKSFQCREKIVCSGSAAETGYGNVGPKTKALLQESSVLGISTKRTDADPVETKTTTTSNSQTTTNTPATDSSSGTTSVTPTPVAAQGIQKIPDVQKPPRVDTAQCIATEVAKIAPFLPPNDDPAISIPASARTASALYKDAGTGFFADDVNYFEKQQCTSAMGITTIRKLNIIPKKFEGGVQVPYHDPNLWKDSPFLSYDEFSGGFPIVYFTQGLNATQWTTDANTPKGTPSLFNLRGAYYNAQDQKWYIKEVLNDYNDSHGVSSQDGRKGEYVLNDYLTTGCNQFFSSCALPGWGPTANKPGSQSLIPGVLETPVDADAVNKSYALYGYGTEGLSSIREGGGDVICRMMNPTLYDFSLEGRRPKHMIVSMFSSKKGVVPGTGCPSTSKLAVGGIIPDGAYSFVYVDKTVGWQLEQRITLSGNEMGAVNYIYGTGNPWKFFSNQGTFPGTPVIISLKPDGTTSSQVVAQCKDFLMGEPSGYPDMFLFTGGPAPYIGPTVGVAKGTMYHDLYFASRTTRSIPISNDTVIMRSDIAKVYRDVIGRNPTLPEAFVWSGTDPAVLRAQAASGPIAKGNVSGFYKAIIGVAPTDTQLAPFMTQLANGGSLYDVVNTIAKQKCSVTVSLSERFVSAFSVGVSSIQNMLASVWGAFFGRPQ